VITPRLATSVVFFLHGLGGGMWASRIPAIQENLALGVGPLGLALLGGGLGPLLVMVPTGALLARYGSRQVALASAVFMCVSMALLPLAPDATWLFGAMVLWGAGQAALDVTMNAQGSAVEQRRARPLMSSLHGLWSLGNMSGAAVGAVLAGLSIGVRAHFLVAAPLILLAMLLAARSFVTDDTKHESVATFAWPRGVLLALAAVAFCAVATEGAMFDWAGIFLRRSLNTPEATAALAPSFFSAAMAVGRLAGDHLIARVRAPTVARGCALVAAGGVISIILAPAPAVVFGGLIAVGLGLSVLVPLVFGVAGRSQTMHTGTAIAAVATVSYFAFLIGPPTIGLIAEQVTLRGAFFVLVALLGSIVVLAPATGERRSDGRTRLDPGAPE
jgi:MFS family permease